MTTQAEQQAEATAARVLALWALVEAGRIDLPNFTTQAAGLIYAGKVATSRLADVLVSMLAQRPALGITPGVRHIERLKDALETITDPEPVEGLEAPENGDLKPSEGIPAQLHRLAVAEAMTSHQKSTAAAIKVHGFPRYREKVAANACEICQPFRDAEHDTEEGWEPHHPGCRCSLEPDGEPAPQTPEPVEEEPPLVRITKEVVWR